MDEVFFTGAAEGRKQVKRKSSKKHLNHIRKKHDRKWLFVVLISPVDRPPWGSSFPHAETTVSSSVDGQPLWEGVEGEEGLVAAAIRPPSISGTT